MSVQDVVMMVICAVCLAEACIICYLIWGILEVHDRQREDNAAWADKLLAVKAPVALSILDHGPKPKDVHYVDEQREVELGAS
jgi:hypothetical protein